MFRNYFKVAIRNILRHKAYAAINITGLAIGIAACMLLFLVVKYEYSYNKYNKNHKRIFHLYSQDKNADGLNYNPGVPYPVLEALRTEHPKVTSTGIHASYGSQVTVLSTDQNGDKKFIEDVGLFFLEPQFFQIFDAKWLAGNASALADPNNIVLTKTIAEKYFKDWQSAMGRNVKIDNALTFQVAGIIEDLPGNTDLPVTIAASFQSLKTNPDFSIYGSNTQNWGSTSSNFQVFVLLPTEGYAKTFSEELKKFSKKHYNETRRQGREHPLQPIDEMHFDTRLANLGDHVTSKSTLITLSFIGILIIIMACINFVNLSTAQAVGRSKEIGVRKVLGGNRLQLFRQMMGETGLIVLIALLIAIVVAWISLPFIKDIVSIKESLSLFTPNSIAFIGIVAVLVTLFAGLYPSLILSGFKPALALKNKISSSTIGGISIRRGLVVLQFAISQVLIIGTIVAISQMNYVRSADLGLNKDAVFVLSSNTDSTIISRQEAFKGALSQIPGIRSISFTSDLPSSDNNWGSNFAFNNGPDLDYTLFLKYGDQDYFKTFELQLIAGRALSQSDTVREGVVNETLVKKLGIKNPNDIIGKTIRVGRSPWLPIVGVVKDFKTNSLREAVKPTFISTNKSFYGVTAVKLHSSDISKTQKAVLATWDKLFPEYASESYFMDERIERFYQQENQLSILYKIFAGLAIFISCLGLYGLVSFLAVQKTKEVGIRKVLGASVGNIVYLFSREFTILIAVAFVLATPIAYYMMNNWLNNFVYKINIGIGVFILAIAVSIGVAWITVGYKAIKAALANPVKSIRTE